MTDAGEARTSAAAATAPRVGVLAVAYLLVAGSLYGLLFSINKLATTNGVPGLAYVFWHTLGAALILWLGCLATRTPVGFDRAHLRLYFVAGAIGIAIPVSLLAHVAPKLPASLVVMVTSLSPTCTYLMAMSLRMERFRLLSTGGVVLGLAGILILVVPGITLPTFAEVSWLLLALLAPVCFAAFNITGALLWPPKAHLAGTGLRHPARRRCRADPRDARHRRDLSLPRPAARRRPSRSWPPPWSPRWSGTSFSRFSGWAVRSSFRNSAISWCCRGSAGGRQSSMSA